ncbi:MAG: hypothetical protein ACYTFW_14470 [Planctomycetota bacterium]
MSHQRKTYALFPVTSLLKPALVVLCMVCALNVQAELSTTVLIRLPQADESIIISIDRPVYFPGDTVRLSINREDTVTTAVVTPMLSIKETALTSAGNNVYIAVIPPNIIPGSYQVHLDVLDSQGRRLIYKTDCVVSVEEYQGIEQIGRYMQIVPEPGGMDEATAVTLDREQIRNLQVVFHRDSIREGMGPQFITIKTTVMLRNGATAQTFERRVLTFRSRGDPYQDREMFVQYRKAYGPYAAISSEELEQVDVEVDSLPNWAIIQVSVAPDYTIKIGAVDRSNCVTRYYRVRGQRIEAGLTLGVPKVLYDTQADDSIDYGNTSAMLRFYYVDGTSGHRFPISLGFGTFGVNSPIDMSAGEGGFATSVFLDIIELMRRVGMNIGIKVNAGFEMTPFFPIERRSRLLFNAQVGLAL